MFWAIVLDAEEMGERSDRGHSIPKSTIFQVSNSQRWEFSILKIIGAIAVKYSDLNIE
jgi:hypothetical protein